MPSVNDIIQTIEQAAPLSAQESWDNSGLLVAADLSSECSGVMLCLDVTPSVISQAIECGCNLVVSHHPLIFKGIKGVNNRTLQGDALIGAIKHDISVYCAHTSLDNAEWQWNVSAEMARMTGAEITATLSPSGTGVLATLPGPVPASEFCSNCAEVFTTQGLRYSRYSGEIKTVAFGSGACGFLIVDAIAAGADAIVTSDVRYHDFLDYGQKILIVDLTHFDTEKCTKALFMRIISQKFSNFAFVFCASETNPIAYL